MLQDDANDVLALNNLAFLLIEKLQRPKEALKYAERAHELRRRDPNILDTLGWVKFHNGDVETAERMLSDAVRMLPGNAAARYHLGRVYAERGFGVKAREAYERALKDARRSGDTEIEKIIDEALKKLP